MCSLYENGMNVSGTSDRTVIHKTCSLIPQIISNLTLFLGLHLPRFSIGTILDKFWQIFVGGIKHRVGNRLNKNPITQKKILAHQQIMYDFGYFW